MRMPGRMRIERRTRKPRLLRSRDSTCHRASTLDCAPAELCWPAAGRQWLGGQSHNDFHVHSSDQCRLSLRRSVQQGRCQSHILSRTASAADHRTIQANKHRNLSPTGNHGGKVAAKPFESNPLSPLHIQYLHYPRSPQQVVPDPAFAA